MLTCKSSFQSVRPISPKMKESQSYTIIGLLWFILNAVIKLQDHPSNVVLIGCMIMSIANFVLSIISRLEEP